MNNTIIQDDINDILAHTIDILYLKYKADFCDWENQTHKLGWFKEAIKRDFAVNLKLAIIKNKIN